MKNSLGETIDEAVERITNQTGVVDGNWTPNQPTWVGAVHAAMAKVQSALALVGKTGRNTFHKYDYSTMEDIRKAVHPHLVANNLYVNEGVTDVETLSDRITSKGGTEYVARVKGWLRVTSGVDGSSVVSPGFGEGQDAGDKAVYKATTGMRKYAWMMAFGLASSMDPEAFEVGVAVGRPIAGRPVPNGEPQGEAPQVATPPEGQTMTPRQKLVEAIREWSRCDPEQIVPTMLAFAKRIGIEGRKLTDPEVEDAIKRVAQLRFNGATWERFLASSDKPTTPPKAAPPPQPEPEPEPEAEADPEMEEWQ